MHRLIKEWTKNKLWSIWQLEQGARYWNLNINPVIKQPNFMTTIIQKKRCPWIACIHKYNRMVSFHITIQHTSQSYNHENNQITYVSISQSYNNNENIIRAYFRVYGHYTNFLCSKLKCRMNIVPLERKAQWTHNNYIWIIYRKREEMRNKEMIAP